MLKLKDFRSSAKGLPDLLPYAALIGPGTILNKDGSFTAAWEVRGQDTASSTSNELAFISHQMNQACRLLGSGWMLHMDAIRNVHYAYPPAEKSKFRHPVSQMIEDERRKYFSGCDKCYSSSLVLSLTYKPSLNETKLAGSVQTGAATMSALEKGLGRFSNTIAEFEDCLSGVLRLQRLTEHQAFYDDGEPYTQSDLLSHVQQCVSGILQPMRVPSVPMYLDALLGSQDVIGGIAPKVGDLHLAALSLDGLPQESWPQMLYQLDSLPLEYRFSTRFICLDQYDAIKEINSYRKGWRQQVYRFIDQFLNNPNARANRDALLMAEDAEQALTEVQGGLVSAGYLSTAIVLANQDPTLLEEWARELRRCIQTLGFGCRLESINALETWLGTHPGNSFANVRRPVINTLNLADLLPLTSVWTGSPTNPCPFYPAGSPPLAIFQTDGNTPFFFNIHSGDIGHTLIFGPTGSGKSTLLSSICYSFQRYEHGNIFAFDKGLSLFPLNHATQGEHFNIGVDDLAFAPLQAIDQSDWEASWAEEWIGTLVELQGVIVTPAHRNAIHTAMQVLRNNPPTMRSLTDFYHTIQDMELKEAIQHYTAKGAMGRLLDASDDNLGLSSSDFFVFEMEEIMSLGDVNLIPVILYLFHRIEKALRGQPALIVLDEAWIMLGHPVIRDKLREWLKVMRKNNCAVVLATQSLSDAAKSGILDVLVESCPTKVFLPNVSATQEPQHELYLAMGLNERQIEIISTSKPKQDYYVVSPQGRRKVQLALGDVALSFAGASDKESIARIKELSAQYGRDNWQLPWLQERGAIQ